MTGRRARLVDGAFFLAAGVSAVLLAYLLLRESRQLGFARVWLYVLFWLVLAYVALPRVHGILTRVYVPGYFVGRTRTSDGLLADPVNLALLGSEPQVHGALTAAGWVRADPTTLRSSLRIVTATLGRRSYDRAPVSPLLLFDRPQDAAYQQEVAGNPARRHHLRLWRCPDGWELPGGRPVDWLGAATYDRAVGLSLFTLQVTHRIGYRVDEERDHVVATLRGPAVGVEVYRRFSVAYRNRSGGGDPIETDGDLPVVDLRALPGSPVAPAPPGVRRPVAVWTGGLLLLLRAVVELVAVLPGAPEGILPGLADPPVLPVLAVAAVTALTGAAVLLGSEAGRLAGLTLGLVGVVVSTWVHFAQGVDSGFTTDLVGLSLDILVLAALTSPAVGAWTRRAPQE